MSLVLAKMEELIEAVRSEKCLYDVKHQDYMNTKLKDSKWKLIAEALNLKDGITFINLTDVIIVKVYGCLFVHGIKNSLVFV